MTLYPRSEPGTDAYAASRALFDTVITRLSVSAHGIPQLQGFDAHVIPHPLT
jgi:hypothetical protein